MCLNTKDLQRIFHELDKNGDGFLSIEELNGLLERIFGTRLGLQDLESSVGKSTLSFDEFFIFYHSLTNQNSHNVESSEEEDQVLVEEVEADNNYNDEEIILLKAFNVFDLDGDGYITCEELKCVLSRLGLWDEKNGKDCRSMICVYDTNLDGVLDFEEFKNMMLHGGST